MTKVIVASLCVSLALPCVGMEDRGIVVTLEGKVTNYCLGGGDHRKLIPFDGVIRNPFRETTHFGCESEGGKATYMPDLDPAVKDGKLA